MPKMRKEKRDTIIKLIAEGYTNIEISEKTGVTSRTIGGIRKQMEAEREATESPQEAASAGLSSESMIKIGHLQAMYGAKSPDEAIEKIFEDLRVLNRLKFRFDNDVNKTPSQVLSKIVENNDNKIASYDNIFTPKISFFHQMIVFNVWGIDPAVKAFHEMVTPPGSNDTLLQFMENAVIGSYNKIGFKVEYYWNEVLEQNMPIITTPEGVVLKFPISGSE